MKGLLGWIKQIAQLSSRWLSSAYYPRGESKIPHAGCGLINGPPELDTFQIISHPARGWAHTDRKITVDRQMSVLESK